MKNYKELKEISEPYIRHGAKLPSNSFLLAHQLGIKFMPYNGCKDDLDTNIKYMYRTPAFLVRKDREATIYYNEKTAYWNFYIFHEIAHYLLAHEGNSLKNEQEANMLGCLLAAPMANLPTYLKTARDLSCLCDIPIDKAEEYWQEIRQPYLKESRKQKSIKLIKKISFATISFVCIAGCSLYVALGNPLKLHGQTTNTNSIIDANSPQTEQNDTSYVNDDRVYVSSTGTKYHHENCPYIKDKQNLITYTITEAESRNYAPCSICSKD